MVRRSIVDNITLTARVKTYFIQRVRDVDSTIRSAVFKKITAEDHFEIFTIEERLFLLKNGLNDRCVYTLILRNPIVIKECGTMLRECWIQCLDKNVQRV